MTARSLTDEADICARFARRSDSEGYSETEFRNAMQQLLAQGIIRKVPYQTPDGTTRYKIERAAPVRRGASR
jgi:hypothetical protein